MAVKDLASPGGGGRLRRSDMNVHSLLKQSSWPGVTPLWRENLVSWPAVAREPGCAVRCRAHFRGLVLAEARAAREAVAAVVR